MNSWQWGSSWDPDSTVSPHPSRNRECVFHIRNGRNISSPWATTRPENSQERVDHARERLKHSDESRDICSLPFVPSAQTSRGRPRCSIDTVPSSSPADSTCLHLRRNKPTVTSLVASLYVQHLFLFMAELVFIVHTFLTKVGCVGYSWWRGTAVERWSLAGELSLSCARSAGEGDHSCGLTVRYRSTN